MLKTPSPPCPPWGTKRWITLWCASVAARLMGVKSNSHVLASWRCPRTRRRMPRKTRLDSAGTPPKWWIQGSKLQNHTLFVVLSSSFFRQNISLFYFYFMCCCVNTARGRFHAFSSVLFSQARYHVSTSLSTSTGQESFEVVLPGNDHAWLVIILSSSFFRQNSSFVLLLLLWEECDFSIRRHVIMSDE